MASPNNTSASASKDVFPFLSLPAEIRNIIYPQLLVGGSDARAKRYTQILRTCKQVNQEATGMLYAENVVPVLVSSRHVLFFKLPLLSTFPLQRVVRMEIHMQVVFNFWDYDEINPKKVREHVKELCQVLAKHHSLKELTLRITWAAPSDFGMSYSDHFVEESILSQFFVLRNIPTVNIDASTSEVFNRKLREAMQSPKEEEDTV